MIACKKLLILCRGVCPVILMVVAGFASATLQAQEPAAARIPSQILAGKKAFISNGGETSQSGNLAYSGGPARAYNQFYAAVKAWNHFELVTTPAEADLVFAISFIQGRKSDPRFSLVILDPKTHIAMWTFSERVPQEIGLQKTRDKNFDRALAAMVRHLEDLVSSSQGIASSNSYM